jgi:muramoyltetrapeptide carboxypeptidase
VSKRKKTLTKKTKVRPSKSKKASELIPLQKGDVIEIIAPGSHAPLNHLEKGAEVLRQWGYEVVYDENLLKPEIFLSNTDEYRFNSFKKAITNPNSKIVWCLRGGYGSIRLLPFIEKMAVPKNKKILIGLSDISSLQTVMTQKWGWPCLHSALIDRLALEKLTEKNIQEIKSALTDPDFVMNFSGLKGINKAAGGKKKITGEVVGGNLMVIASTLGTPSQIKTKNKIVFLEELCERAYRVDRCLQQLKQAGAFEGAKAIVFGDFTNCDEPNKENYIQDVLSNFCATLKIPAFTGIENGHGELQRPLFFNTKAEITSSDNSGEMKVYSPFKSEK